MYWYDGRAIDSESIELKINAPELCFGASVFTTLRIHNRSLEHHLTQWQAHCDRLKHSLSIFYWQQPDWKQIRDGVLYLSQNFPVIRIAIFPNGKEFITGRNLPSNLKQRQVEGIVAWVAREDLYRRELPSHKTGNYLASYLARERALSHNAQEAILIDDRGNWLETSTGNLWGWRNNYWYTPSLKEGILPGIQRAYFWQYLQTRQISVTENIWTATFVSSLEAIFYSNCVVGIIPIACVIDLEQKINYSAFNFPLQQIKVDLF